MGGCGLWIANCANLWRTGADLEATWSSIMKNLDQTAPLFSLAGVKTINGVKGGHWNDLGRLSYILLTLRSYFYYFQLDFLDTDDD